MIPIGLGLAWAGYAAMIWGYCLIKDYNVTFPDLFKATWPGGSSAGTSPGTVSSQVVPTPTGQPSATSQLTGQ
jgi:hypothetical protein